MIKRSFEIGPTKATLAALGILATGVAGTMAWYHRKAVLKALKRTVDPQVTLTSGGGPGVGARLKGTPFMLDMDPTGPGAGVAIPMSTAGTLLGKLPFDWARKYGKKLSITPGNVYTGVEMAGILPLPFVGVSAGIEDKAKLMRALKALKK